MQDSLAEAVVDASTQPRAGLSADRAAFRRRLLWASAGALAAGGLLAVGLIALGTAATPDAWMPYLLAPLMGLLTMALDRAGHRAAAVTCVALAAGALGAQSGIREVESVAGGLYLIPVAMFCMAFIDAAPRRRALLAGLFAAVLAQRLLRGVVGVDVSTYAWVEGTFHCVAVFGMFAVLVELLHHRQSQDRHALERIYDDVADARRVAEAEAAAAVESSRTKSRFLAAMSHELRTPLNAVVGYAELLLDEEPDAAMADDLARVRDAGNHMVGLVDDVLDVSKVASGRLERELAQVSVAELLHDTATLTRPLLQPGVALRVEGAEAAGTVVTDGKKLRQVLVNLSSNAARFTHEGEVVLGAVRRDATLELTVRDTGQGMDPGRVDGLFEPFAQIDHRQGSGLGLALCARFVDLLGGRIDVDTALGRGSTFTVSVPSLPAAGPASLHEPDSFGPQRLELPATRRAEEAREWLEVGSLTMGGFGVLTAGLVASGALASHLGVAPFLALAGASVGAFALNRMGQRGASVAVFVLAAIGVDAHSHVFHPHAQAAVLYLVVVGLFVSLVLPRRHLPRVLWAGGFVAGGMLSLRWQQGLDTVEGFVSILIDTAIIYTSSALFLGMIVGRHRHEEAELARATFDLDRLRIQSAEMARAATAASHAKSSFLAAMSHELRSPLNAILGYSELLLDDASEAERADLESIRHAAKHLLGLINEVLDLARVQAGGMPIHLAEVQLTEVVASEGLAATGAGVAQADPHLLRRSLSLLRDRGVGAVESQDGQLRASVPYAVAADAREPFAFDPCLGRPGVGWALLGELVEAMDGEMTLTPADGGDGMVVELRLPVPAA